MAPTNFAEQSVSIEHAQKKSMCAGILIDEGFIAMVLSGTTRASQTRELLKWSYVMIPESMNPGHVRFAAFLKNTLEDFLGRFRHAQIWTAVDTKYFKLRNIIIPDIPESKTANAAIWEFKKEFEILPDQEIFDYQIKGDIQVDGIKKKKVVAFSAEKDQISLLISLFSKAGFPLAGITALPFAFCNFFSNGIIPNKAPVVLTNVSRYYSNILCLSPTGVLLVRNIKTGALSLIEDLIEMDMENKEQNNRIDISEILNFDTLNPLFDKMSPSSDRLISKIVRTGDYCSNNFTANAPMEEFLFFGETDNCEAFIASAREQIPNKVSLFNPFEGDDISSSLKINPPLNPSQRNGIIPAYAISLSSNEDTPNFLYTYEHKKIEAKQRKINSAIMGICAASLLVCLALGFWLSALEKEQIQRIAQIDLQIAKYTPTVNQDMINTQILEARKKAAVIKKYTTDYLCLAVINEICSKTPDSISIISLDADFRSPLETGDNNKKAFQKRSMVLNGVVKTDHTSMESMLTGYIIKLGDSPFFQDIVLKDKKLETENNESHLIFTAVMEMI
ncbi:MAG: hypothetical protein KJ760_08970 [Proteobacteria bacterium]|nr:hypothetical protein [Pseudomonadota bacterium]